MCIRDRWDVRVVIPNYSCIPEKYRSQFEYVTHFYMSAGTYIQDKYVGVLQYVLDGITYYSVSYTHLDVYKRQVLNSEDFIKAIRSTLEGMLLL